MDKIEMLWSGGWDSTYMLCMEARKPITIKPYYIVFHRPGEKEERAAMVRILKKMKEHKEFKARILPVKYVDSSKIVITDEVRSAFEKYKGKPYKVGGQYLILAAFALQHKGIYLGQERYYETPGHLTKLMYEKGHMKFTDDGVGYFNESDCDKDVFLLFGNYTYPIAKKTELIMQEDAEHLGFMDIMDETWFCYTPTKDGKPCGACLPCVVKYNQHLYNLLPVEAQARAEVKNNLPEFFGGRDLRKLFESYCQYKDGYSFETIFRDSQNNTPLDNLMFNKKVQEIYTYEDYFDKEVENAKKIILNRK